MGDPDCAAPPDIVVDSNLQLSFTSVVVDSREEDLSLLDIVLEQRAEIATVAEPQQCPEFLFKRVLDLSNLVLDAMLALIVDVEGVVEQHDRQVTQLPDLDFVRLEKLAHHS